jgi:transcriptional regulator with XRE-family HTH domain
VDEHRERIREVRKQLAQMKKENPASRPNYSELARKSGVSRQTISRIWKDPYSDQRPRKKRGSKFDPYQEEIRDTFEQNPITIKKAFLYFQSKDGTTIFNSYNSFKDYVLSHHLKKAGRASKIIEKDTTL